MSNTGSNNYQEAAAYSPPRTHSTKYLQQIVFTDTRDGGYQTVYRFSNGWGASVINNDYSHGTEVAVVEINYRHGLSWELAMQINNGEPNTHVQDLDEALAEVEALPQRPEAPGHEVRRAR